MSALGMDSQGIVRSAFEFKDEFDRTGVYNSPYCCPFCETEYVDKCIANPCKKAPHFSLKSGTLHLSGCNGEGLTGLAPTLPSDTRGDAPGRTVVGDVDFPESLVEARRERGQFGRRPKDAAPLTTSEISERRRRVDSAGTIESNYTSSLLRTFVQAHRRLQDLARTAASAEGHQGSEAYNAEYRKQMHSRRLELYGVEFTYGSAFYNSRLSPATTARIYQGEARVRRVGDELVLQDSSLWPREYKSKDRLGFFVVVDSTAAVGGPKTHRALVDALVSAASENTVVGWSAYGIASRTEEEEFVLRLESLDHIFLE